MNNFTYSSTEENEEEEHKCGCNKKPQQEDKILKMYLDTEFEILKINDKLKRMARAQFKICFLMTEILEQVNEMPKDEIINKLNNIHKDIISKDND